jgi:hypothetical protein|tara:strand:+ start:631 stop:831 length:201 start_codon:yes stop_codon:yes gene_type:complete
MKYLKFKSLTWWASFMPLIGGVLVASEALHGWSDITATIDAVTGGVSPSLMINAGLLGIGFRAAIK